MKRASPSNRGNNRVRTPTTEDHVNAPYADMAQDAYQAAGRGDLTPRGYTRIDVQDNTKSGLAASAYYCEDSQELVVAFRGTELGFRDFAADAQLFRGKKNPQTSDAVAYARRVQGLAAEKGLSVLRVTYTGHSLGGGLATEVAALRNLRNGEANRAVVFEAPGIQKSLERQLGRPITPEERARFQRSQVNYRTNTPISGPNNPVSATKHHTSQIVNLHMERSPPQNVVDEVSRRLGSAVEWTRYTIQQHDMTRIRQIMGSQRGVGLDPLASAAEAKRFVRAFDSRIQPTRNPFRKVRNLWTRNTFIRLRTIHGENVQVRVDAAGTLRFNRPGLFNNQVIDPERFNIDLTDPYNRAQLVHSGAKLDA